MSRQFLPVVAVIVLYRQTPENSTTLRSMVSAYDAGSPMPREILVFDNGGGNAGSASEPIAKLGARYAFSTKNLGVQGGYEAARRLANEAGLDWLWLLDQDTELPGDFFECMAGAIFAVAALEDCVAVCPFVEAAGRVVSPLGMLRRPSPGRTEVLAPGVVTSAINSGALVRRQFVDELGGFDDRLWLDGLDHWLFLSMRARQKRVAVVGVSLTHALSVVSGDGYVSVARYRSILASELILYRELYTASERLRYLLRLVFRCAKHPLKYRSLAYLKPTLAQLFLLIVNSRGA